MLSTSQKVSFVALAGAAVSALLPLTPAHAASSEESRYTHSSCEGTNIVCGVIVMGNAGGFTLDWVSLEARGSQPGGQATHPSCSEINKKISQDVPAGNYDTFIVPAACAYKLKIKILLGNSKDQNLYLTPGCQLIAKVKGTTTSNSWKSNSTKPLNDDVPTNDSGTPVDPFGHKCGKQSNAGF